MDAGVGKDALSDGADRAFALGKQRLCSYLRGVRDKPDDRGEDENDREKPDYD
jgi:hypothetical protein